MIHEFCMQWALGISRANAKSPRLAPTYFKRMQTHVYIFERLVQSTESAWKCKSWQLKHNAKCIDQSNPQVLTLYSSRCLAQASAMIPAAMRPSGNTSKHSLLLPAKACLLVTTPRLDLEGLRVGPYARRRVELLAAIQSIMLQYKSIWLCLA